jgi:hypothetical protein
LIQLLTHYSFRRTIPLRWELGTGGHITLDERAGYPSPKERSVVSLWAWLSPFCLSLARCWLWRPLPPPPSLSISPISPLYLQDFLPAKLCIYFTFYLYNFTTVPIILHLNIYLHCIYMSNNTAQHIYIHMHTIFLSSNNNRYL